MREQIKNVVLNLKHYPGVDLYSDGEVEDKLLSIAQEYTEEKLNQAISEFNDWSVLYHFSHIRQNIVTWMPITKQDTVLEIGSGCGAITGALADMAKSVTCIELSKKRSLINANRNGEKENIEILVGNFTDVEKDLTEKYDYITLIGVFEYAEGYMGTNSPYIDFLTIIKKHLKPGGKLVIAIENRNGLKYWAGCKEDHVGKYFEGIENYPTTSGIKTFTKAELEELLQSSGICQYEFYYPYPDYKLPLSIYSDKYLPRIGELNQNSNNFDRERVILFDESKVFDEVIKNNEFPKYANSFLVVGVSE